MLNASVNVMLINPWKFSSGWQNSYHKHLVAAPVVIAPLPEADILVYREPSKSTIPSKRFTLSAL